MVNVFMAANVNQPLGNCQCLFGLFHGFVFYLVEINSLILFSPLAHQLVGDTQLVENACDDEIDKAVYRMRVVVEAG